MQRLIAMAWATVRKHGLCRQLDAFKSDTDVALIPRRYWQRLKGSHARIFY